MSDNTIRDRGLRAVNLAQFNKINEPLEIESFELVPPTERQYVLRCLIKRPFEDIQLPDFLQWCKPLVESAFASQKNLGLNQPFCYLTVRHGIVDTKTDDVWHVDGFSTVITHLPEQNYAWCSHTGTEYVKQAINFPSDFDPLKHNVHEFLQDCIVDNYGVETFKPKTLYCFDPYVIHRRPSGLVGQLRTFVRLSFTPIEIADVNNTLNPLIQTNYTRDGRKDFRDKLIKYEINLDN